MDTWSPLWSKIVDSSLIAEADHVFKAFVALLAVKDSDHVARLNAYQLGRKCWPDDPKGSEKLALSALKVLASPDRRRIEPQPHDGRRIQRVDDGWLILNGEHYRKKVSEEMRKARLRKAQTTFRKKRKAEPGQDGKPASAGYKAMEERAVSALENGDEAGFERLAERPVAA